MSTRELAEPRLPAGPRTHATGRRAPATTDNTLFVVVEHDSEQTGWASALAAARLRERLIGGP
ncbi:hypothetical protein [Streptomyces sp. NPDC048527]|uniref:hypothetical protein n=1 Tax=Streptomyces sp. NPDC048527 TaxID=3365568 RepID=UPI0037109107